MIVALQLIGHADTLSNIGKGAGMQYSNVIQLLTDPHTAWAFVCACLFWLSIQLRRSWRKASIDVHIAIGRSRIEYHRVDGTTRLCSFRFEAGDKSNASKEVRSDYPQGLQELPARRTERTP
jgi:hypothetical protein